MFSVCCVLCCFVPLINYCFHFGFHFCALVSELLCYSIGVLRIISYLILIRWSPEFVKVGTLPSDICECDWVSHAARYPSICLISKSNELCVMWCMFVQSTTLLRFAPGQYTVVHTSKLLKTRMRNGGPFSRSTRARSSS
jgi:hypothetical protein